MVSIVITTKNAEEFIADCIKSVINSNYIKDGGEIEIILVDNYSTDRTVEIAKYLGAKTFLKGPERSAQRNYGVEQASGEIVGILDVDMTLSENAISECVEIFENNENIKAIYIPEKIFGEGFFNKVRNFERSFYNATVIDGLRFFRREDFLKIGGFDTSLNGTEDWDFDRRMKTAGGGQQLPNLLYIIMKLSILNNMFLRKVITLPISTIILRNGDLTKRLKNNSDFIIVILAYLSKTENGKNYSLIRFLHFQCIFYCF